MSDIQEEMSKRVTRKDDDIISGLHTLAAQNEEVLMELRLLNHYKEAQKKGDIKYRNNWAQEKVKESRKTQILLFLACIALSLDVIQFDDAIVIVTRLLGLV